MNTLHKNDKHISMHNRNATYHYNAVPYLQDVLTAEMFGAHSAVNVLLSAPMCLQKLLDWKMAEFRIQFQAVWSQDGVLEMIGAKTEGMRDSQNPDDVESS